MQVLASHPTCELLVGVADLCLCDKMRGNKYVLSCSQLLQPQREWLGKWRGALSSTTTVVRPVHTVVPDLCIHYSVIIHKFKKTEGMASETIPIYFVKALKLVKLMKILEYRD